MTLHMRWALAIAATIGVGGLAGYTQAASINDASKNNQTVSVPLSTPTSKLTSASKSTIRVTLRLLASKEAKNGSITKIAVKDARFVVVSQSGKVLGVRRGDGSVRIRVQPSGFWDASNKDGPTLGTVGIVEVLAYAPRMVDTIMMDVPVSEAPITANSITVPMMPMVNPVGRNTPNEPNVMFGTNLGTLHHLVIDGVSGYYSKYAHITASASRNSVS